MDLKTKLGRLQTQENLVLYKWTAGKTRIADEYILLSDLRFNVLTCNRGRVILSIAAPVLFMDRGRPHIKFSDNDVLTIADGERKGINILSRFLRAGESATPAQFCSSRELIDDKQPKWVTDKVLSMGCSNLLPVSKVIVPEILRMSKHPENLRPIFTSQMLAALGATRSDTVEQLLQKFQQHLALFGVFTAEGYVISNDYIATGGCCVVPSRGITMRSGSMVHQLPLSTFRDEMERKRWNINTGEEDEVDTTIENGDEHATSAADNSDDRRGQ